jgi:hypothetical protein
LESTEFWQATRTPECSHSGVHPPDLFQANIALSPSFGLDDRFVAQLAGALANPGSAPRFVFIGAGGDEEADISVGAMRFAKTFEGTPSADIEFHYESFPGETHGSWDTAPSVVLSKFLPTGSGFSRRSQAVRQ